MEAKRKLPRLRSIFLTLGTILALEAFYLMFYLGAALELPSMACRMALVLVGRFGQGFSWELVVQVLQMMAVRSSERQQHVFIQTARMNMIALGVGWGPMVAIGSFRPGNFWDDD